MTGEASDRFDALASELTTAFRAPVDEGWADQRFDALALRVFEYQFERSPVYRRFCLARDRSPDRVSSWTEVPLVPTSAFKALSLSNGPAEVVFQTSGTSRGAGARGRHGIRSLELYRAASIPGLRRHLLPDTGRLRILSLVPEASEARDSSLSRMVSFAFESLSTDGGGTFMSIEGGLDLDGFGRALHAAVEQERPVWVMATAFALVHWLDAVAQGSAEAYALPAGSRILETGGFKGRSREVPRHTLYEQLTEVFGIPVEWIVNEYGMTELLSQFYDAVAGDPAARVLESRRHRGPPWMRTRVLDPTTLEPVAVGEAGLLAHFDLANLGSVSAVLTEDQGVADGQGGFRVIGRTLGAEPRGCSLALDELLASRTGR